MGIDSPLQDIKWNRNGSNTFFNFSRKTKVKIDNRILKSLVICVAAETKSVAIEEFDDRYI